MKNLGWLLLLSMSSWVYAGDGRKACLELGIQVQNNTAASCYLISSTVNTGFFNIVDKSRPVFYKLLPGQTETFIVSQDSYIGPDVTVTYECGSGEVSFSSRKALCLKGGAIDGTLLSASNMSASFESHEGAFWSEKRGVIHWTLVNE